MMSLGGTLGLILSLVLMRFGFLKRSFLEGEPMTKNEQDAAADGTLGESAMQLKDYTPAEVRREMRHEVAFLLPPALLATAFGVAAIKVPSLAGFSEMLSTTPHLNGILGAIMGAFIGALVVWLTRILGSLGFGREAMGMGDVHLMFGVGAVLGAGMSTAAFFPFAPPGPPDPHIPRLHRPEAGRSVRAVPLIRVDLGHLHLLPDLRLCRAGFGGSGNAVAASSWTECRLMRQVVHFIWWWTRVAILIVIGLYALLSLWNNTGKPITVWYWFGHEEGTSVVGLALASFFAGGILCSTALALFTATLRYRRTREHRRQRAIEEQREELSKKASRLRTKPVMAPIVRSRGVPEPLAVNEPIVEEYQPPKPVKTQATKLEAMKEERIAVVEVPVRAANGDEPIHVNTQRATPFASGQGDRPRREAAGAAAHCRCRKISPLSR